MPLARLENFLKNLNGNILYVDPNELDATDSIDNRGNSKLRPFKTIQRALLEAARFAYVPGSNNDLFDQTTILISPGTHYIDNRPGYYVNSAGQFRDINNGSQVINELNILSNFDINDPLNELYIYNSIDGGVILPKGTSIVSTDLRKTKIRPKFVPDPNSGLIAKSSIFKLTGACYIYGFTIFDGDPLGTVYNTYSSNRVSPSFSHHKLTAFEYADGVNKVTRNGSATGYTDLEMYYYKIAKAYGNQSSRSVIDGALNLQPNIDEYRIVGDLGAGEIGIESAVSGDGLTGTNIITITTETPHLLNPLTPILISGLSTTEGPVSEQEYNGNFTVLQVIDSTTFTYALTATPTQTLIPSTNGATMKVISDTVTSSSPYVFNCSLKSVYGMNGLHADGSKATGFKSIVTAQFTGISLQKDDRAFVKYNSTTGAYQYQSDIGVSEFLHQDTSSIYRPDWESFHIKVSNDAFIQCVSIFAIGYANQFLASDGGDQSITNSNSNFGQRALYSEGFKKEAFAKDNHGYITHVIPPKDLTSEQKNINTYIVDVGLTTSLSSSNSNTRIYLKGYDDVLTPPSNKIRGYSIGGASEDKIYYTSGNVEYYANINPRYRVRTNISSINLSTDTLTVASISGIDTGLSVKIASQNSIFPDGIENQQTYFARPTSSTTIKIFNNLTDCQSNVNPVNIKNSVGVTTNNLFVTSKVSDILSGQVGSPIQWDNTNKNWYVGITTTALSPNFVNQLFVVSNEPVLFLKRNIDTRSPQDKTYRFRYVIPKESIKASPPVSGYVLQNASTALDGTYSTSAENTLVGDDILSTVRNKNAIIDAYYSSGTATIVTKNPHNLTAGNKINIYNLKSSNEPIPVGLGTGTGFNGEFTVASVIDDLTFTYSISVDPGTISVGISTTETWLSVPRNCSQSTNFRIPPYTIYNSNRNSLPYFTTNQLNNHYQVYKIDKIQDYVEGNSDGIYHITVDAYKNTPPASPFNLSTFKLGQSANNLYPISDLDNPQADPDSMVTIASRSIIGKVDINDPENSTTKETTSELLKDFGLGRRITQFSNVGVSSVTVTVDGGNGATRLGGIKRVEANTLGSGYYDGAYYDLPLCGGSGKNATVNLTVSSGSPGNFIIANPGSGYLAGETLTIKGIPGSVSDTTVDIPLSDSLLSDLNVSDVIQILGAKNSGNNGSFVITGISTNTITYTNSNRVSETSSNAVAVLSGIGYPISTVNYSAITGIATITTSLVNPHSFSTGSKVLFNVSNLGICTITNVSDVNTFTVKANSNITSANRVYSTEFVPTVKDTNSLNENLNTRQFTVYGCVKSALLSSITSTITTINPEDVNGFKKGDIIQIESEILIITRISGGDINVRRAQFGTQASSHPINSAIKVINVLPVELRRPSILRASSQTFEYTGFGPGNYSTSMPSNQDKVLTDDQVLISQSLASRGGLVVYSGMNSNGEFFIGKQKYDAVTGDQINTQITESDVTVTDFDSITVNQITVNDLIDASTANAEIENLLINNGLEVTGISTFNSNVTVTSPSAFIGNGTIPVGGIIMWSGSIVSIPTGWALCNGSNGTPNLIDRFIVGAGSGYNVAATGGSTDATLVAHTHTITDPGHSHGYNAVSFTGNLTDLDNNILTPVAISATTSSNTTGITINSSGSSATNANLPPYYALAFIMRVS
jgi:hypothetical protein